MISLFRKEISLFFNTLTGYLVIGVYLVLNTLFLWVIPGAFNIPESNQASLHGLFTISPWLFLFLVPAITMRMIADERKAGTIDLLFIKPISDIQIIAAKYLASLVLVAAAIIPTLVTFFTVYHLGYTPGNMDVGATIGSYIGLFFLAAIYAAIGVFASSITENSIVSFIIAAVLCLLLYIGFDTLSQLSIFSGIEEAIKNIGINEHYNSISRGVIDSRDLIYFAGVSAIFILLATYSIEKKHQ